MRNHYDFKMYTGIRFYLSFEIKISLAIPILIIHIGIILRYVIDNTIKSIFILICNSTNTKKHSKTFGTYDYLQ